MEFRRIGILGAGAVGAYALWGLAEAEGTELCLVAEGARAERLRRDGVTINGREYRPTVKTPAESGALDLLIVALKYGALREALPGIQMVTGPDTAIMSLMNGVDSEETIGAAVGMRHMVHALIKVQSERRGSDIRFDPETTVGIVYGEADPQAPEERTEALGRLFARTPLRTRLSRNIVAEMWAKYLLNVSKNLPQAVLGVGAGAYDDSEHVRFLRDGLAAEVLAVAAARGVDLAVLKEHAGTTSFIRPAARFSTLQDLEAGRATEVDMLAGALMRMGEESGVATPFAAYTYHAVKALEEKNAGKFRYE
ncbi:MAG: 2-dehydropantoate 2-reductase [Clostridia bacterium]|nr:2-dehydropantoate 2-reductase [Clostridia bacterium]